MRKYQYTIAAAVLAMLFAAVAPCATAVEEQDRDVLYQVSTIDALMLGVYDGVSSFGDLEKHGGFGIGTFDALDGEMIALDGEFYQVKDDGVAYPVADNLTTPFATVTFFDADETVLVERAENYTQFEELLNEHLPSENVFYAIRIDGTFPYVETRSVPKQEKPYPLLKEAIEEQSIFQFYNVTGTMLGFWTPEFVDGINVPGYHLHFITQDRKAGGHVLEFQLNETEVKIDVTSDFFMALPTEGDFYHVDLTQDLQSDLEKVEK
jgi:acetolactate decarboxylase